MEITKIPFNKPYLSGMETDYLNQAVASGHISGNGPFTKKCQTFFEERWGFKKCLLTTSCTDALEMCALLLNIKAGDELIIPSFTFVSTALAFSRQGAKIVFADSQTGHPNLDPNQIEDLITPKTKAIVVVHYAGVACDMDQIMRIANKYKLIVIEDAAQCIDSYYKDKALGTIGHLACFSFHETKNIQCGEGGMLAINDEQFIQRSEIIWEKGTNRAKFFRGEIDKYGWVDTGSSFLISDLLASFLFAQLESLDRIQQKRTNLWASYLERLKPLEEKGFIRIPEIHPDGTNNAHMFFILLKNIEDRTKLAEHLKSNQILAVFHYQSLHKSKYMNSLGNNQDLPNSDYFEECLLRLPLYYELSDVDQEHIIKSIFNFFE